jgi:hypothetical protein
VWIVGRFFRKGAARTQATVDLVGGNLKKLKTVTRRSGEGVVIRVGGLEQRIGADNIGIDKRARSLDRAVDVAFGGKVHDPVGRKFGEMPLQGGRVANVGAHPLVARMVGQVVERAEASGIGEYIEIEDGVALVAHEEADEIGSDEAGTAGDEYFHKQARGGASEQVNHRAGIKLQPRKGVVIASFVGE